MSLLCVYPIFYWYNYLQKNVFKSRGFKKKTERGWSYRPYRQGYLIDSGGGHTFCTQYNRCKMTDKTVAEI